MSNSDLPNLRLRNALTLHQAYVVRMVALGTAPAGLERAFAAHIEVSPSLWSQIKSGRTIGEKLARQIESKSGRPSGWLDEEHSETGPDPAEEKFLSMCRAAWRSSDRAGKGALKALIKSR